MMIMQLPDMAHRLGKEEDAAYFAKRADYYKICSIRRRSSCVRVRLTEPGRLHLIQVR